MTISELEDKLKKGTITKGEKILLDTKKRIEEEEKKGIVYFKESSITKKPLKMDF